MPTKYRRLALEAHIAAEQRNHEMNNFERHICLRIGRFTGFARCKKCGMLVFIDTDPPPNGIRIGGEAVALNCSGKAK